MYWGNYPSLGILDAPHHNGFICGDRMLKHELKRGFQHG